MNDQTLSRSLLSVALVVTAWRSCDHLGDIARATQSIERTLRDDGVSASDALDAIGDHVVKEAL